MILVNWVKAPVVARERITGINERKNGTLGREVSGKGAGRKEGRTSESSSMKVPPGTDGEEVDKGLEDEGRDDCDHVQGKYWDAFVFCEAIWCSGTSLLPLHF